MRARYSAPCYFFLAILVAGSACVSALAQPDPAREKVLDAMDRAQTNFRSIEAAFVWDQFTSLVNETDTQNGKVYFRRAEKEMQMAVDIEAPYPKYLLLTGKKLQLFTPRTDQVTVYDISKHPDFEAFVVLGFGGGGHPMLDSFDVKYAGTEKVDGVDTSKLDLTPKSAKARGVVTHILLWIDLGRGISVRQQLFQPGGDYRLAKYSDIRLNQKVPDTAFKLKTNSKTTVESMSPSHD